MANVKQAFATSQSITITLANLASSATAGRESAAVDNTADLFDAIDVTVAIKLAAGTPANDKVVFVAYYESENGTTYDDNATGVDAALTERSWSNLKPLGTISCPDSGGLTYRRTFRIYKPKRKWGIYIRNYTGLAFDASGHSVTYTGVYTTVG